jgi:hypothetical protein
MAFDYWKQAHDALLEYHQARSRDAAVSVLNRLWHDYQAALEAAQVAESEARSG